jgi:hypothetical protein
MPGGKICGRYSLWGAPLTDAPLYHQELIAALEVAGPGLHRLGNLVVDQKLLEISVTHYKPWNKESDHHGPVWLHKRLGDQVSGDL